jgi:cobalt-zinc-cadmium efflux system protein
VVQHAHPTAGRVLTAASITIVAGAVELAASRASGSLFLLADAVHLLAHLGIFVVLLLPALSTQHETREDIAACSVLSIVVIIGVGIAAESFRDLIRAREAPVPQAMLIAILGLAANLTSAWLFRDPARERWSFRAALAHELADASLTIAGLIGAGAIALFHFKWVDPGLSLLIAAWLLTWALRLLAKRVRLGRSVWNTLER